MNQKFPTNQTLLSGYVQNLFAKTSSKRNRFVEFTLAQPNPGSGKVNNIPLTAMSPECEKLRDGAWVTIAGRVTGNEYNGKLYLNMQIQSINVEQFEAGRQAPQSYQQSLGQPHYQSEQEPF